MEELTAFQRDLLYIIVGLDEPYGLAIKDEIEKYRGDINNGRLYPNLDRLDNLGLIKKGEKDDRTNSYKITDLGEEALDDRNDWENKYYTPNSASTQAST